VSCLKAERPACAGEDGAREDGTREDGAGVDGTRDDGAGAGEDPAGCPRWFRRLVTVPLPEAAASPCARFERAVDAGRPAGVV
jgi:hypothetical protein